MHLDDPNKPEFASWSSYQKFSQQVRRVSRFVWKHDVQAFLDTVLATLKDRDVKIRSGRTLFRAQQGIDYTPVVDEEGEQIGEEKCGYGGARMTPLRNRAKEGRANPAGIPVLYLASTEQTAISEVRPWVGSEISVAQFKIIRDIRIVNLSLGHGHKTSEHVILEQFVGDEVVLPEKKEKAVWVDIDNAFSRPVTLSDDAADYVPTQILAELFRNHGYDGIIYRSQFGEKGYNVALFSLKDAKPINCAPYHVTSVEVKFEEVGNRWFSSKDESKR